MAYELTGTIKVIMDTQTFDSGFSKREFVVTTADSKYPQDIKFEMIKDKGAVLDAFGEGQEVKVTFDVSGNEYNGKFYVNLQAWRIEAEGEIPAPKSPEFPAADDEAQEEATGPLPF